MCICIQNGDRPTQGANRREAQNDSHVFEKHSNLREYSENFNLRDMNIPIFDNVLGVHLIWQENCNLRHSNFWVHMSDMWRFPTERWLEGFTGFTKVTHRRVKPASAYTSMEYNQERKQSRIIKPRILGTPYPWETNNQCSKNPLLKDVSWRPCTMSNSLPVEMRVFA